jgi:hypothetical protein
MNKLLFEIQAAFKQRKRPSRLIRLGQLSIEEYNDVEQFITKLDASITCDLLERYYDSIYWLSAEAFCFFLPDILIACIRENEPNLLINHSLIGMLDRSPDPSLWDDFFLERWTLLNQKECAVVQEWILWISSFDSPPFEDDTLSRSLDTLELLKKVKPLKRPA